MENQTDKKHEEEVEEEGWCGTPTFQTWNRELE